MKIVTADQMRAIERRSEAAGVSTTELMEHAGRSVAGEALSLIGEPAGKRVLVLVGPGNNGGDGLVAARELHDASAAVAVYLWKRDPANNGHTAEVRDRRIPIFRADEDPQTQNLRGELGRADLIVDALLGTGRSRPVGSDLKAILDTVNARAKGLLLAVDLPTGIDADRGAADESALRADVTITLGFPKIGLFTLPAAKFVGKLVVGDIGLPPHTADDVTLEMATPDEVAALLPARPLDAHKGTSGKVMVVGGCQNYLGAPVLAALAAGRAGAGLVSLACAQSLLPVFGAKLSEATFLPLPDLHGGLQPDAVEPLLTALEGYNTLIIGPGLGRQPGTVAFALDVVLRCKSKGIACLIDADCLNALASQDDWQAMLPEKVVLTPHSGELARLLRIDVQTVDRNRLGVAVATAKRSGAVVVLKGAFTIVAEPDGGATINPSANPALATAGTGDVLAGTIGGLLAQGLASYEAAVAGVFLHAKAGQMASDKLGDVGMLAGDLLPLLPRAIKTLKTHGSS